MSERSSTSRSAAAAAAADGICWRMLIRPFAPRKRNDRRAVATFSRCDTEIQNCTSQVSQRQWDGSNWQDRREQCTEYLGQELLLKGISDLQRENKYDFFFFSILFPPNPFYFNGKFRSNQHKNDWISFSRHQTWFPWSFDVMRFLLNHFDPAPWSSEPPPVH